MGVRVVDLAGRPDLVEPALALGGVGPGFLGHDLVAALTRARRLAVRWPEYFLVLLDDGIPVARAVSVPVVFPGPEREELPEHGWDGAVVWAAEDALDAVAPTCLVALDVQVAEDRRGAGIAARALVALRDLAAARGLARFVVPVRPAGKSAHPRMAMADYVARRREDGLPQDPWLRTHERVGGRVVGIAPFAMTVVGTVARWREWTGRELVVGENEVEGALVPVVVSAVTGIGIYVEPNAWVEHVVEAGT